MRRTILLLLFLGACTKKPAPPHAPAMCKENGDCDAPLVCLSGTCTDPRSSAFFLDPKSAVTPDKVKRQVEGIQDQHDKKLEKVIEDSQ
jgi:hypothetical protein